jgi:hypothetical protein
MPASGAAEGVGDIRLMPEQAPNNAVSVAIVPSLATVRTYLVSTISVFPRTSRGRTRPAAKRKTAVGAMTSGKLRQCAELVSLAPSYIDIKNGLSPLLDRNGVKPYFRARN